MDIGSNTATFAVYAGGAGGFLDRIRQDGEPLRLLRRIGPDGAFAPATVERTLTTMRSFVATARAQGVEHITGVATSAMRDATNGADLVRRIREEAGLPLTILDGDAEARAAATAAVNTLSVTDGLVFDLGGGSLQVAELVGRGVGRTASLPLGGLRLADAFLHRDPPGGAEVTALRRHVEAHLRAIPWLAGPGPLVGIGGTVRALSKLDRAEHHWPVRHDHGYLLPEDAVLASFDVLSRMTAAERAEVPGLAEHRVDTIVSGAIVIAALLRLSRREAVRVSGYGLREGVAWRLLHGGDTPDVRRAGLAGRLPDPDGVGRRAAATAARIFDARADELHLHDEDREALLLAVRVRALGAAPEVLLTSAIQGYTQEEVIEAAALLGVVPGVAPEPRLVRLLAEADAAS